MIITPSVPSDPSSSTHATYRLKRGTRIADVPTSAIGQVPPLSHLNGPFQLAEYLALQVKHDPHDVKALVDVPKSDGQSGGKAPEKNVWIYEHLRRLPIDLTPLLTGLIPTCTKESCPEMKADQWLYFCSAHANTEECCAIDYILHTVDSTTALLNSSQQFPSRMSIPPASLSHFPSLFRRLSRIFSHAYFHHREVFSLAESETSLYARFVALCEKFELVGMNLLVIPHEVVGTFTKEARERLSESDEEDDDAEDDDEDEDEFDDEEDVDPRGRGEKGDSREKRTRSLDRHGPPASSSGLGKPGLGRTGTVVPDNDATLPTTASGDTSNVSPNQADPFRSSPRTVSSLRAGGAGTLGRGKQPRGTMLWNSDMSDTVGEKGVPIGPELTRTESNQTAVLLEEPEEELSKEEAEVQGKTTPEETEPLPVPKDEIELLEEEGVIPPENPVSPLPPAETAAESETQATQPKDAEKTEADDPNGAVTEPSEPADTDKTPLKDAKSEDQTTKQASGEKSETDEAESDKTAQDEQQVKTEDETADQPEEVANVSETKEEDNAQ